MGNNTQKVFFSKQCISFYIYFYLCSAGNRTQDFVHGKQALYQ